MSGLPKGWATSSLGAVGEVYCGQSSTASDVNSEGRGTPYVTGPEQWTGSVIELNKWTTTPKRIVPEGCIFITVKGAGVGKLFPGIACAIGRDVYAYEPAQELSYPFVMRALAYTVSTVIREARGDIPGLSKEHIIDHVVPLPPLAEQKRIVAKLDGLNARSARARTELARIETLVSRYKQAVLSKAFSGELTSAKAAESNVDRTVGQPPHWRQMQLGEIADIKSGITLGKKRKSDEQLLELPYLRVANVQRGWLDLREIKTVAVTAKEAEALLLREGDVLMNEGGDRDKLGRGWVWNGQIPDCIHQNHVFRVRLTPGTMPPRFLSYYTNEFGQKHFFHEGKQTTNLASISKSKLSAMQVPVPPFEEAKEIVRRIESAFAKLDRLAAEARRALNLVGKLDEAILAKAFRGELVPQDENDEPAEKLLERIRAERSAAPKARRGRGRH